RSYLYAAVLAIEVTGGTNAGRSRLLVRGRASSLRHKQLRLVRGSRPICVGVRADLPAAFAASHATRRHLG
uniref:hypothetical protein n=1 Tax=Cognatiluteimonas telluris TaxID=1104775 RepID=UPI001A9C2B02